MNLSKEYLRTLEPELGPGYSAKDLVNRSNAARSRVEQDNLIEDFRQNGKNENSSETSDATAIQENLTVALDSIQDNMDEAYEDFVKTIEDAGRTGVVQAGSVSESVAVPEETLAGAINTADENGTCSIITLTTLDGQEISYRGNEIASICKGS